MALTNPATKGPVMPTSQPKKPAKPRRRLWILVAVLLLFVSAGVIGIASVVAQRRAATGTRQSMMHGGRERHYRIHVPRQIDKTSPVPLVFCFHGGGGTAEVASRMGFSPLAKQEGFLVVYPEGLNRHWNDGRNSNKFAEQDAEVDDVAFVLALLKRLQREFRIDTDRVYATGASNGGFFCNRLAIEASDKFAAVAVMIATLPKPFEQHFKPQRPVSVLFMNGTADPFVPYGGDPVTPNFTPRLIDSKTRDFGRGAGSSTDEAVKLWLNHNGLDGKKPTIERLPDKDPRDGCRVERRSWSGGKSGSRMVLYRIEGGGHTIPGGTQYLPERIIGRTCRDFDGLQAIWQFFKGCSH